MKIIYPENAFSFLQNCRIALEEDEVNGNLILGISDALSKDKNAYGNEDPFFSIIYNNNEISLIGLMTPPKNLLLYEYKNISNDVMELFVNGIHSKYKYIPGITGEKNITKLFLEKWVQVSGCNYKIGMNLRVYKLTEVNKYIKPNGMFRSAENNDIDIVAKYINEFSETIHEGISIEHSKKIAESSVANKEIYVWEDKNIVSMAKKHRPTRNGMAVSYVYTPMEYRQKGYATAVVAELSRNILNSGKSFCTLYTDLSNPTSNSIYQKIGYNPICDYISYSFEYK